MQREGSACCTTPSGVIRIAITGQTWAQGAMGSSQCIQTVGCVATLIPRSIKSTITILSPLCESHSRQAASQARQPMQREGSTNRVLTGNVVLLSAQKVFDSFSGCSFVSPTSYGNIFGPFSGVKLMVTSPGPEGTAEPAGQRPTAR